MGDYITYIILIYIGITVFSCIAAGATLGPEYPEEIIAIGVFWPIHLALWLYKAFLWSIKGRKGEL